MSAAPFRLLVLGATGRVGQLLRRVWDHTPPTAVRPIYQSRHAMSGHVTFAPGDDPAVFGPVDGVLALWGVTAGTAQELAQNTALAVAAERIASACGAGYVLHASSIAAYAPLDVPMAEDTPLSATAPYGLAKADMERALASMNGAGGLSGQDRSILRFGSIAGAESLAAAMAGSGPIVLDRFPDGAPMRSYIAPSDLARVITGLCALPKKDRPDVLNVGAPNPIRMHQLLEAANHPFDWRPAPDHAREVAILNTDRLTRLLPDAVTCTSAAAMIKDLRDLGALV